MMDYLSSLHNTLNSMPEPHKSTVTHACNRSTEEVGSREPELECYCLVHSMNLAWESRHPVPAPRHPNSYFL